LTTPPIRFTPANIRSTVVGSDDVAGNDVESLEDRHWKPMLEVVDWEGWGSGNRLTP
jgi:hypothetical protein